MSFKLFIVSFLSCLLTTPCAAQDIESCPAPEMKRFRNSCIWEGSSVASFHLAEEKCKRRGGHLAMPKDYSTQQFIKDLVHGGSYNSYWVGVREVEDKKWVYVDHTPVQNFTYWAPGEPGGAPDEDCVLLASYHQTKWVTTQCHWGYRFVCQLTDGCSVQDLTALYNLRIKVESGHSIDFHNSNLYSVGSRVHVECNPGFIAKNGPSYLHCEIGGKWTNSTKCVKGCQVPVLPPAVRLLRSQIVYSSGDTLPLTCEPGKVLQGNLKCDENGNWLGASPTCVYLPTFTTKPTSPTKRHEPQVSCPKPVNFTHLGVQEAEIKIVPHGTSISLPCVTNIQKWPHGLWMKEQNLLEFGRLTIPGVRVLTNGTLHISKMSSQTEGLYTCIAFGSKTEERVNSQSFRLMLPRECNLKFDPPPSVHVLSSTNFVLLRCHVQGALMSWFTNGQQVINSSDHILLANSALLVHRTARSSGDYTCRAENAETHCRVERSVSIPFEEENVDELCGRAHVSSHVAEPTSQYSFGKLVGGHVAPKGSHPWIVIFINMVDGQERFLCGGNLINNRWVATAAHCFFWVKNKTDLVGLKAKLGKYDRLETEPQEKIVYLDELIRHPDFDTSLRSFDNDIALVRLSESVKFSDTIMPICLPQEGFLAAYFSGRSGNTHTSGTVSGWGRLEEDGLQPRLLHQVRLPLVEYNRCKESTRQHVTENMFCAGYDQAVADSCQGDSGGPFELYVDGVAYLAGIVSWGEGCARPKSYGFYTKVENYLGFIAKTVK